MIQAILFDFDGVLLRPSGDGGMSGWEALLGASRFALERLIYGGEMGLRALLGDISDDDLWAWVGERFALPYREAARLRSALRGGYSIDLGLADLIARLRRSYKIALVSNAPSNLRDLVRDVYRVDHLFDQIVCSAEERVVKPDPEIYFRALARLGLAPEQAVLVDDQPANVAAARAMSMLGIVFEPATSVSEELEKLVRGQ